MSSKLRFKDDDEYELSSSEDEYNENEKKLLKKIRNRKSNDSESETEVLAVGSENDSELDDSDAESDIALSDVEGQEPDDDLPDIRAWGKEKKKYYGADYVDPDYGGFQGKDAQAAEIEEEEAKQLQRQLVQQLDDNDFGLDIIFNKKEKPAKEKDEEIIKTDYSILTHKQKLQILQKESPELFGLIDDFKVKITLARDFLQPVLEQHKAGKVEMCKAVEFVETQYQLILNYATNIYMYLMLKATNQLQNHPVIKKLYQYRQLLLQMEPVLEEIIKPQIEILLNETDQEEEGKNITKSKKKKTLKLLEQLKDVQKKQKTKKTKKGETEVDSEQPKKRVRFDENIQTETKKKKTAEPVSDESEDSDMDNDPVELENKQDTEETSQNDVEEENAKRGITYQIAKNKGLTPYRKKELRNPRVKHRIKFKKALIRRKGAVREPRKELSRYSGEISGIKASVSKSIKIKS